MLERVQKRLVALIRWSERYTQTDMIYLVRGGIWLSVAQFGTSIAGFLLTLILANILTPERLGEYRFLITGFTLLSIFALPGMRTALRESTPKGYRGNLTPAFKAMFKWGLVGSVVSIGATVYYFLNDNNTLAIGFLVIAIATPLYNAATGYLEYLTALKELRKTTLYTVATRIILVATTGGGAFLFPHYAWAILAVFLFATIIPNLWFHLRTKREFEKPGSTLDQDITRYAWHITAMTALGLVAGQLDKILVWKIAGAEALAFFFIAYTVPLALSQYLIIIPTLAFAKFGEKEPTTIRRTLLPKTLKYLFVIIIVSGAYIVAAPLFFNLFFPLYTDAILYSQVLALVPIFGAFLPIKTYLTTLKRTKDLYILSVIPPAMRIAVAVSLIVPFGIWGAVYSLLIEAVVRSMLLIYFFLRTPKDAPLSQK